MGLALFDALQDFGPRTEARPNLGPAPREMRAAPPVPAQPNLDDIIRQKVSAAEAALRADLVSEHEAALAALTAGHDAEIEKLRRAFGEQAGKTLEAALAEAEARITAMAVMATARMVGSILSEEVQKRSIDRLVVAIREAMADRDALRIRVSGPQSLFEALSAALGAQANRLDYAEAAGFDLTVSIDGNLLETRLAEWSAGLSEVLA